MMEEMCIKDVHVWSDVEVRCEAHIVSSDVLYCPGNAGNRSLPMAGGHHVRAGMMGAR